MAAALGMTRIVVPPSAGLFSSFGLLYADVEHHYSRTFRRLLRGADLADIDRGLGRAGRPGRRSSSPTEGFTGARATAPPLGRAALPGPDLRAGRAGARRADRRRRWSRTSRRPSAPSTSAPTATAPGPRSRSSWSRSRSSAQACARAAACPRARSRAVPSRATAAAAPRLFRRGPRLARDAGAAPRRSQRAATRGPLIVEEYDATCLVPPDAHAALDAAGNIVIELQP